MIRTNLLIAAAYCEVMNYIVKSKSVPEIVQYILFYFMKVLSKTHLY
jgi:hypothetical protein